VPEGVWEEVVIKGKGNPEVEEIKAADWIFVEKVTDLNLAIALNQDLDKGEAEAISLAIEKKADIIFLDEIAARTVANVYKLNKTGVLGVLILAKLKGEIPSLWEEIKKLQEKANFWLNDALIKKVLKKVGETYEKDH